jgi:hypothetical protein
MEQVEKRTYFIAKVVDQVDGSLRIVGNFRHRQDAEIVLTLSEGVPIDNGRPIYGYYVGKIEESTEPVIFESLADYNTELPALWQQHLQSLEQQEERNRLAQAKWQTQKPALRQRAFDKLTQDDIALLWSASDDANVQHLQLELLLYTLEADEVRALDLEELQSQLLQRHHGTRFRGLAAQFSEMKGDRIGASTERSA